MLIKQQAGFTLLELMTVLAIIGILTTISYPVYNQHVIKTRRSAAEMALLDAAMGMERYFTEHNSYSGATLASIEVNAYTDSNYYKLVIAMANDTDYLLQAFPEGGQQQDKACGTVSLNQLGEKTQSGSGSLSSCW